MIMYRIAVIAPNYRTASLTIDCLMNGMMNPVYTLACGGLSGLSEVGFAKKKQSGVSEPCLRQGTSL